MAIAFDNAAGDAAWTSGTSDTISKTNTGSNICLVAGVGIYSTSGANSVTGITYNSVALTKIVSLTDTLEGQNQDGELWYLDNAASGTHNLVASFSISANFVVTWCASYTGKTSTGIDASGTAQDNVGAVASPTCNVNVVASDCWLVGFGYNRGGTSTAGTGTTSRGTSNSGHIIGDSNGVVSTGNQSLHFNASGGTTWPAVLSASISAGGGGGGGSMITIFPQILDGLGGGRQHGNRLQ